MTTDGDKFYDFISERVESIKDDMLRAYQSHNLPIEPRNKRDWECLEYVFDSLDELIRDVCITIDQEDDKFRENRNFARDVERQFKEELDMNEEFRRMCR